ncbi:hypothetical protein FH972_021097 [Carpinus fangiana]|uniref:FAS1 domain-containing protein n=1 Tax=Carpinus fangiana TaxID=176857 RepID=A0A5N6KNC6_9ROSI|nr:hypothetical protein FH972_021097 [Carpinus fangiana]
MKSLVFLQLVAASTAFVLPDAHVFNELNAEVEQFPGQVEQKLSSASDVLENYFDKAHEKVDSAWSGLSDKAHNALDDAVAFATKTRDCLNEKAQETYFDAEAWLDSASHYSHAKAENIASFFEDPHHPPHHGPPHDGPPHHGPPHHGPPHHKPPHHHKPNQTVYELIASSKYTTKLAKLVSEYPDLVKKLNGTKANYTVFAPIDSAFAKIPEHAPKPSKKVLEAILTYHVSPEFYPAGRVLVSRTIPTLLQSPELSEKGLPQRLATSIGFRGLTVNFYSHVVAVNIFGTNGVIHGVDSIILPPPEVLRLIEILPSEFSTLDLGLTKTGLLETLNKTAHKGSTFFAPSNFAFAKLGSRINAFLFSPYGLKYLKALLEYHVVYNQTLYSDEYYPGSSGDDKNTMDVPKGRYHFDLPTLLEGKSLAVDIARYGRLIEIKINAFARVSVSDGVAKDGVVHAVSNVLIPPKTSAAGEDNYDGGELTEEDLIERLEPFVRYTEDL